MVAPVIGEGRCLACGGPTKLRKGGVVVKYCSTACGKRYRERWPKYKANRKRYGELLKLETEARALRKAEARLKQLKG